MEQKGVDSGWTKVDRLRMEQRRPSWKWDRDEQVERWVEMSGVRQKQLGLEKNYNFMERFINWGLYDIKIEYS